MAADPHITCVDRVESIGFHFIGRSAAFQFVSHDRPVFALALLGNDGVDG